MFLPTPTSAGDLKLIAIGLTCVSVVLLIITLCLTVAVCQRRHRQTGTSETPINTTSVTHDGATDDYDPSSHFYETIDLDNLKVQLDKDKSETQMNLRQENGRRISHTSINSLYGYIGPPSAENIAQ
nr:uncharacterized protein LOC128691986 [Cherax quadricarinatus]